MKPIILFFCIFVCLSMEAQNTKLEVVSTAGTLSKGTSTQLEWTLGELMISQDQNSNNYITAGFHQPNVDFTPLQFFPTEIEAVKMYPNPVKDVLMLQLVFVQNVDIRIQLLDIQGKLVWSHPFQGKQFSHDIEMLSLVDGIYILKIVEDTNQFSQSFLITKIN